MIPFVFGLLVLLQGVPHAGASGPALGVYPLDDLSPIASELRNGRVVGLGESIHGSGGYTRVNARMIRFMVEKLGYRAIGLESAWLPAHKASIYVRSCQGTSREALHSLYGNYWDKSMQELLEWLCQFNQNHPHDPVELFGIDIQQSWDDRPAIETFVAKAQFKEAEPFFAGMRDCFCAQFNSSSECLYSDEGSELMAGRPFSEARQIRCRAAMKGLETAFQKNKRDLIRKTSASEYQNAARSVYSLNAYSEEIFEYNRSLMRCWEVRDRAMFRILLEFMRDPRRGLAKTVIWAHNSHVAQEFRKYGDQNTSPPFGAEGIGDLLRKRFGEAYIPIGLIGFHVATPWSEQPLPSSPNGLGRLLNALPWTEVILDTRGRFLEPGRRYEIQDDSIPNVGLVPSEQFRFVIHLERSPPMELVE